MKTLNPIFQNISNSTLIAQEKDLQKTESSAASQRMLIKRELKNRQRNEQERRSRQTSQPLEA